MCLRIMLNPIFLVLSISNFKALSVGAVYKPSGHQPWSSGPNKNALFNMVHIKSMAHTKADERFLETLNETISKRN